GAPDELRHDADVAAPLLVGGVHRHLELEAAALAELGELDAVEEVGGRAGAVQERQPAVALAVVERMLERAVQRRKPDAAGDDHEVATLGELERPRVPERPA